MTNFSVSLTLQPSYHSHMITAARQTKHTGLRVPNFAHSPELWRQPRLANVTYDRNWRLCEINPAVGTAMTIECILFLNLTACGLVHCNPVPTLSVVLSLMITLIAATGVELISSSFRWIREYYFEVISSIFWNCMLIIKIDLSQGTSSLYRQVIHGLPHTQRHYI
jgi:hypothetical protein